MAAHRSGHRRQRLGVDLIREHFPERAADRDANGRPDNGPDADGDDVA